MQLYNFEVELNEAFLLKLKKKKKTCDGYEN